MSTKDFLSSVEAKLSTLIEQRESAAASVSEIRGKLIVDETAVPESEATAAADTLRAVDAEIDVMNKRASDLRADIARDEAVARMQADIVSVPAAQRSERAGTSSTQVREPRTYNPGTAGTGTSFFADALRFKTGDLQAQERIHRHAREVEIEGEQQREVQQRAVGTSAFAGLVVPQYIVDKAVTVLRRGRPLVELMSKVELPPQGMSFVVPRQTGGNPAAVQAAQNTSVNDTNSVWIDVNVPVVTIAAQSQLSFQSTDRGSLNLDILTYQDMIKSYAEQQDLQLINGSGTAGQMLGIRNSGGSVSTAFGAAATWPTTNSKIAGAIAGMAGAGTAVRPSVVAMHPRRWGAYTSALDTGGRPLALYSGAGLHNAATILAEGGAYSGDSGLGVLPMVVGFLSHNIPVITDANIPTNLGAGSLEDQIYVIDPSQHLFFQAGDGMPTQLRFENVPVASQQGVSLTETLAVYGYCAFTAARQPLATAIVGGVDTVSGNGLTTPVF